MFLYKNKAFPDKFNFKITESIPFIIKVIFEYYDKIKNTIVSNKYLRKKGIKEHNKIIKEISKYWTKTQHSFYRFFFFNRLKEIELIRYYIIELMLPFINKKEMELFKNSKYYFIQNKDKIKYLESNKFQYDFNILKNFHEYLQECKFVKWSNELHNEDALKRNFNHN